MIDLSVFLKKVRRDLRACDLVYITFDGVKLISIRGSSNKIKKIRDINLTGVYYASATDMEIVDDCIIHIEEYHKRQAAQSERLNKAMGLA